MSKRRYAEKKPLSFSTTMRNPDRIASFLKCVFPYEGKILTHEIIMQIMSSAINAKIYKPLYISLYFPHFLKNKEKIHLS